MYATGFEIGEPCFVVVFMAEITSQTEKRKPASLHFSLLLLGVLLVGA